MTIQELLDYAILNSIPMETPILLHDFTGEFHPAHILDRDDLLTGEPLDQQWPAGNPLVLSSDPI